MSIYNITHKEDIDGMLSYGILKIKYPNIVVIPAAHSSVEQDVDLSKFKKGDVIFITDFCLNVEDMRYLSKLCKVIWIDHHISSITKMKKAKIDLYSKMIDTSISACGLVWKFCYPIIPIPLGVEYCTKYDAWTHNGNMDIVHFNYGIYSLKNFDIHNLTLWKKVIESDLQWIQEIIKKGETVLRYMSNLTQLITKNTGTECQFEDNTCWLMGNIGKINTIILQYFVDKYDVVAVFNYDVKTHYWIISLYSNKVDVSIIASRFGGGGHKGASGFKYNNSLESLFKF